MAVYSLKQLSELKAAIASSTAPSPVLTTNSAQALPKTSPPLAEITAMISSPTTVNANNSNVLILYGIPWFFLGMSLVILAVVSYIFYKYYRRTRNLHHRVGEFLYPAGTTTLFNGLQPPRLTSSVSINHLTRRMTNLNL